MTTHAKATYVADSDFTLYVGDVRDVLRGMPDESVHCVVTSPPYWGLRDYGTGAWDGGDAECDHLGPPKASDKSGLKNDGRPEDRVGQNDYERAATVPFRDACGKCGARRVDKQLGLEPTPDEYVANMVAVFREVRRVLRRDGTCWLNIGDSYASGGGTGNQGENGQMVTRSVVTARTTLGGLRAGLKPKDLVGIPWRLAFALQADGWYLRADIIWAKPNPMPESVTDRPTKAHEYVFLLTRSPRYFFDHEAVREEAWHPPFNGFRGGGGYVNQKAGASNAEKSGVSSSVRPITAPPQDETLDGSAGEAPRGPDGRRQTAVKGADGSIQHRDGERWPNGGRNVRSVWEIATQPYAEAHFATFPEALVERCVKAGTSERGCCPECGAPWERETDVSYDNPGNRRTNGPRSVEARDDPRHGTVNSRGSRLEKRTETTGWRQICQCVHSILPGPNTVAFLHDPVPCTVLDPFMGSGTTALVARRLGRKSIGIELNEEYARLAGKRLQQLSLLA